MSCVHLLVEIAKVLTYAHLVLHPFPTYSRILRLRQCATRIAPLGTSHTVLQCPADAWHVLLIGIAWLAVTYRHAIPANLVTSCTLSNARAVVPF